MPFRNIHVAKKKRIKNDFRISKMGKMKNYLPSHSQKILQEAICFLWVPINNFGH